MVYLLGVIAIILLVSLLIWVLILRSLASATPYLPISKRIFPFIEEEMRLAPGSIFYDLGCGDGKVVSYIARKYPDVQCIGIEHTLLPYLASKFRTRNLPNATIRRGDFFQEDLKKATHIYLYLFPVLMPRLLEKFQNELLSGSVVLSCDFKLPNKTVSKEIKTGRPAGLGGTIYVYAF